MSAPSTRNGAAPASHEEHAESATYWAEYLAGMMRAALETPEIARALLRKALRDYKRHHRREQG